MVAVLASPRVRRALVAMAMLAAVYGAIAEIGRVVFPQRIWMSVHYIEDVELVPTYASLAEELGFLVSAGLLQASVMVSGTRVLAGVLLGSLVGLPLGLTMGRVARFEYLLDPWVLLFRFTPALALLPLYVLWLGFGEASKIFLIATAVGVVMVQGGRDGARGVSRVHLEAAAALGACPTLTLRKVVLPAALPHIVASLRIATALAWVTMVVAEFIKPTMPSLGYLLALAGAYPRVPTVVIAIGAIGLLVLMSDGMVVALYARSTRWMRRRA